MSSLPGSADASAHSQRLSYKFQRLRERLRQAILSGEYEGRLPGERELGRRFGANAKTINKALCDLSSEGLVVRHVGRGTYVARGGGAARSALRPRRVCWVAPDSMGNAQAGGAIRAQIERVLRAEGHEFCTSTPTPSSPGPNDLDNGFFRAHPGVEVLVFHVPSPLTRGCAGQPSDSFLALLARRQVATILVGATCAAMKRHAVVPDYALGAFMATEHLIGLGGGDVSAVAAVGDGAELSAALNGFQTACRRHGVRGDVRRIDVASGVGPARGLDLEGDTGLLCIGGSILEAVFPVASSRRRSHPLAAVLEPGDDRGGRWDVSAVEYDPVRMAGWAARFAVEVRAGNPPVDVFVPGALRIRGSAGQKASHSVSSVVLAEAVVEAG